VKTGSSEIARPRAPGTADPTTRDRSPFARTIRADLLAGLTVALVAIPQCMAFATIAGLPAVSGLYAAVVMGLVSAAVSKSPKLIVGPAVTASTMVLAVLRTAAPGQADVWPAMAGLLAVIVGVMTIAAAVLRIGRFVRFVSRSVIVGLMAGSAILTIGSQLAPMLGLPAGRRPMLIGMLWEVLSHGDALNGAALSIAAGTCLFVLIGARLVPRFPAPFVALLIGAAIAWWLETSGHAGLQTIGELPWRWPTQFTPAFRGPITSDLLVGAAAICLVGIIQNLAIARALAERSDEKLHPQRELWALGLANVAAGFVHGFPGSGSFARSALSDLAGARTRLSGFAAAAATAAIAALAAPLARYITLASIAGLLVATAISMVDWEDFLHILLRDRGDRLGLATTVICVFFLPIHWAVLIGLAVSIAMFLRRVSRLHLFEMVRGEDGAFREHEIDSQTGTSAITMLQVEGPLFFAHADELAETLQTLFNRGPRVTILRMRRTQQIDFSVIAALEPLVRRYQAAGGTLLICGLAHNLRETIANGPLGELLPPACLFETTREIFGAARQAIEHAQRIVADLPMADRPLFRTSDQNTELRGETPHPSAAAGG